MGQVIEVAVPRFTAADLSARPGGSDPLGLERISERIAARLVPGITNRMSNPHLLTAVVLATLVAEDLGPADRRVRRDATVAFEWILLASFARKGVDLSGVPGAGKARAAWATGRPLGSANYLTGPESNGLSGILTPLLVEIEVLTKDRRLGPRGEELLDRWATEQQLHGLLSGGGAGGAFRRRLTNAVADAVRTRGEQLDPGMHLPGELAKLFGRGGTRRAGEFRWLCERLLEPADSSRGEIGQSLRSLTARRWSNRAAEPEHVARLERSGCPGEVQDGLRALRAFEDLSLRLTVVFEEWQERSLHNAISARSITGSPTARDAASEFSRSVSEADQAIRTFLGDDPDLSDLIHRCGSVNRPSQLASTVIELHEHAQEVRGNPSWFFPSEDGRQRLRPSKALNQSRYELDKGVFVHAYRLAAFHRMLAGLM
jgi:hypothetical protein